VRVAAAAGRGRPPQAAARRAGLEFVEKLLTERNGCLADGAERMLHVPVAGVPALSVAAGQPFGPSGWTYDDVRRRSSPKGLGVMQPARTGRPDPSGPGKKA
jgi:hypothetical protein